MHVRNRGVDCLVTSQISGRVSIQDICRWGRPPASQSLQGAIRKHDGCASSISCHVAGLNGPATAVVEIRNGTIHDGRKLGDAGLCESPPSSSRATNPQEL